MTAFRVRMKAQAFYTLCPLSIGIDGRAAVPESP